MSDDQPTGDNNLVWLSHDHKADTWSLSCLVSKHVLMAAHHHHPQANTATAPAILKEMTMNNEAAAEVINVDQYLSISKRIEDVDPPRSKRKRGDPWSEMEHRQFLQGLQVHGKGKWKMISRDFVKTRTPLQVASHAQKFFDRCNSLKPKKRKSINDITSFPAAAETLTPLHVYTHLNPNPSSSTHAHQLQPQLVHHVSGNYLVPIDTSDLGSAYLADQDNKMHLPCYASYPPPMLQHQPSLMWTSTMSAPQCSTNPNVQVNVNMASLTDQDPMMSQVRDGRSMMEPRFDPYESPFSIIDQWMDHLPAVPPYECPFLIIDQGMDHLPALPTLINGFRV